MRRLEKEERRGGVATKALIEIDAIEIFGFLSGSYSRLSEKEKKGEGGGGVEERENCSAK